MDKETLKRISIALLTALDRLGYTLDDKPTPGALREVVTAYLRAQESIPSRGEGAAFREALALGRPVMDGGKVYISLSGLLPFTRRRWKDITNKAMVKLLKELGARPRPIYVRRGYTALLARRYWEVPPELIPRPLKGKEKGEGAAALTPDLEGLLSSVSFLDFLKALEGQPKD